jgi:hypothetical protein
MAACGVPGSSGHKVFEGDDWRAFSTGVTCLRQLTSEPAYGCIAKQACQVVQNSEGQDMRFHCTRLCFADPTLCPYADSVEADCY